MKLTATLDIHGKVMAMVAMRRRESTEGSTAWLANCCTYNLLA